MRPISNIQSRSQVAQTRQIRQNPFLRPPAAVIESSLVKESQPSPYEDLKVKSHNFTFINELIFETSQKEQPPPSNLTYCHFSGITEQTKSGLLQISKIFDQESQLDMRCTWEGTQVRVVTPGGQEFVIPMQQDVVNVYAIHDGIILQTIYNEDQAIGLNPSQGQSGGYAYFTVTEHPLNEVHPLGIAPVQENNIGLAVRSYIKILFQSDEHPIIVTHCSLTKQLQFGILKSHKPNSSLIDEEMGELSNDPLLDNDYTCSLLQNSRHPVLFLSPKYIDLYICTLWQITSTSCPESVLLSANWLENDHELVFHVHYKAEKQLAFIKYNVKTGKFKAEHVEKDVITIGMLNINKSCDQNILMDRVSGEVAVVTNSKPDTLQIYKGMALVTQLEMEPIKKIQKSVVEMHNGYKKVIPQIQDQMVVKIIEVLRQHMPQKFFLGMYQDIVECILKKGGKDQSEFEKVSGLFLSLKGVKKQIKNKRGPKQDPFLKMINSEFAQEYDDLDDLFDPVVSLALKQPITRPKSGSKQSSSRSQNLLTQNFVDLTSKVKPEFIKHSEDIFKLLHYLYEDLKLDTLTFESYGSKMARFLLKWIVESDEEDFIFNVEKEANEEILRKMAFIDRYVTDFPCLKTIAPKMQVLNYSEFQYKKSGQFIKIQKVPDIFETLDNILKNKPCILQYHVFYEQTRKMIRAFKIIGQCMDNCIYPIPKQQKFIADSYLENIYLPSTDRTSQDHSNLHPFEQLLYCLQEERLCISTLPSSLAKPIKGILTYCKHHLKEITNKQWPQDLYKLIDREDAHENQFDTVDQLLANNEETTAVNYKESKSDQNKFVQFLISRFSEDSRYKEVSHLLNSSKDMTMKIEKMAGYEQKTEEEKTEMKNKMIEKLYLRHMAKTVGRGILEVGIQETMATEMVQIPKISKTAQIPALETSIDIKEDSTKDKETIQWPLFHNGASSALKIAMGLSQHKEANFVRNWIMQHKPATPKSDHAGFLLSLGLFGLLDCLQNTDIYQHLKSLHDSTTIGILLGKAASRIGSMDAQYTKTLCMHITYLQPPNLFADISLSVQSAAVIGAGLLYKETRYRQITEMLLAQIGRKPINDKAIEREVYSLSSGIALGMVNLGAGQELQTQFGDLNIEERLIRFIEGGKIMELPRSMLQANQNIENQQCSSIREGDQVNVHITSSGGLFALCLIYIQSNNQLIASKLKMPETFHQLEYVRPSFLLQKVLAKNIILWDQIEPSQNWIDAQIPDLIKNIYHNDIATAEKKYAQQIGSECFDFATIALCNINIQAGAIMSLGYKFAGTSNKEAFTLINTFVKNLRKAKIATQMTTNLLHQIYNDHNKNLIDRYTQENCLCVAALALSLVMAGSGDQDCFRTLRVIRKRLENSDYGHNLAINMALGFLFLGSGAFTLGRSPFAIACLMCSLYPIFPRDANDNRYHLQALRHFWVLALETRLVQARDIDTGDFLQVEVVLRNEEGEEKKVMTPAVVGEDIVEIKIEGEAYYGMSIEVKKGRIVQNSNQQNNLEQIIFIKKKAYQTIEPKDNTFDLELSPNLDKYQKALKNLSGFSKDFNLIFGQKSENFHQVVNNILLGESDNFSIFEIEDSTFYISHLFTTYLLPLSTAFITSQTLAIDSSSDRKEWLLFPDSCRPRDPSLNCGLDPCTLQTCHIMVNHFLDQLREQGESALVQQFKQNQHGDQAINEIAKTVMNILKVVVGPKDVHPMLMQNVIS